MGNPQANSSNHQENDMQPQEYQYEISLETNSTHTFEANFHQDSNQSQEQPPQPQQGNAGYGPHEPARTAQFPPGDGHNSKSTYQPPQYPQAIPSHIPNIQPLAYPSHPVQFPHVNPQINNPVYPNGPNQPAAYPPQFMPTQTMPGHYHGQVSPQPFPQARGLALNQNGHQIPQAQAVSFPQQHASSSPYNYAVQAQIWMPTQQYNEGWRTGLFDCMDDPMNALTTACFPCITFGQIAEIIDNGHTSCGRSGFRYALVLWLIGLPCILSCGYRTRLRAKYGLVESPAPDWVIHFFFEWCALCQEYRELQKRGLDPALGWQGNMNMHQQPSIVMMPPMGQRMMA